MPVARVVMNGQPTTTRIYERLLDAIAVAKAEYQEVKRGKLVSRRTAGGRVLVTVP